MNRERILVVDDEVFVAHVMEFSLGMEGYQVVTATDGEEALAKAADVVPDLVVLDILMPGMDGYEVCRQLRTREQLAEVPIILLAPKEGTGNRERARAVGANACLEKPFRSGELIEEIRTLLSAAPGRDEEAAS